MTQIGQPRSGSPGKIRPKNSHALAGQLVLAQAGTGYNTGFGTGWKVTPGISGTGLLSSTLGFDSPRLIGKKPAVVPADIGKYAQERCTCCSKEDLWTLFDVFRSMDKRHRKRISRRDFLEALSDETTSAKARTLRRSGLHQRFRESASDVTLEELLKLVWPKATEEDMAKMLRWVQLREAQSVLREGGFRGDNGDLRKIFDLLDENQDGILSVRELQRSAILNKEEICDLMGTDRMDANLNFQDFVSFAQPALKKMYVSPEMRTQLQREELDANAEEWQNQFRGLMGGGGLLDKLSK